MGAHDIKRGLDLPMAGPPEQAIQPGRRVTSVGVLADDYVGLRPAMAVKVGQRVKRGEVLFEDRKAPGVKLTAPGAGKVIAVHRGARRALQSVVIQLSESEIGGAPTAEEVVSFGALGGKRAAALSRREIVSRLTNSGLWTALRARPFSRTPAPDVPPPHALFVTAADTHPLAPSVDVVLEGREDDFHFGLDLLRRLTEGPTYLCKMEGTEVSSGNVPGVTVETFRGPHPAGTVGLHIHTLEPVFREKTVWHVGYQDVAAVGALFRTGVLPVERVVSLAGPRAARPRLVRTRVGASLDELVGGDEIIPSEATPRVVSGSVLHGREARGEVHGYLGRHHQQVSVLAEPHEREFLRMVKPGRGVFSTIRAYLGAVRHRVAPRDFPLDASAHGSRRAMVPIGMYERVMPLDIMPTHLLRALLVGDVMNAERLGALELDEEDLALCTFVCPSKNDYAAALRETLSRIEAGD
ncbi:MAG: Na(+)-translocating NADH-quinone reductase subunit A [Myxococcota bacterium]